MLANRTGLISAYLSRNRNFPASLPEVIVNGLLKLPCTDIGPRFVESIRWHSETLERVSMRDISGSLYWPKSIPHYELYKSCTDCLSPSDWHHYEVPETTVESGENVVDCGAAEGLFALSVSSRARKLGILEPWTGFRESLAMTFGTRATILHEAVGKSAHSAYLAGDTLYGVVSESGGEKISITTLDDFRQSFGPINYIKADVEGSEHDLLEGAKEVIFADKPKVAITCYHPGNDWEWMLKLLRSIAPEYKYRIKGLSYNAGHPRPVMLHAWI